MTGIREVLFQVQILRIILTVLFALDCIEIGRAHV